MALNPWLGDRRGYLTDWTTQLWVRATGSRVDLGQEPWLAGPTGETREIGSDFFGNFASRQGLKVRTEASAGLMETFSALSGPDFESSSVHPKVREFYEHTSQYGLEVWSEWCGAFRPFGRVLAMIFSRRLQQLNMPLTPLASSRGVSSSVVQLETEAGESRYTGWVRSNRYSGEIMYVGAYSVARVPGYESPCVKVAFPLPNGNATVFMKPKAEPDGSLVLESVGKRFGDPGFYFLVRAGGTDMWVKFLRTFRERIRIYVEPSGDLRTDHLFTIWRRPFLRLHYHLLPGASAARS